MILIKYLPGSGCHCCDITFKCLDLFNQLFFLLKIQTYAYIFRVKIDSTIVSIFTDYIYIQGDS